MKRRPTLEEHLASVPASIRCDLLTKCDDLPPGAAAVVGRFFAAVKARREPEDAPSAACFRAAAASESTLATLLRTLNRHAPHVSTAAARAVREEWYVRRTPKAPAHRNTWSESTHVATWPPAWQALYPGLRRARIKDSSRRRYVNSISRCAQLVRQGGADECLTFYTAWCLTEAFTATDAGIKPITISGYLHGLVALGRYGGAAEEDLDGLRYMRDILKDRAAMGEKRKIASIHGIMRQGGFEYVARRIGEMREEADGLPDHTARKELLLQTIAICAIEINKPARTGDMARWTIGQDLRREADGAWHLHWEQEKTGRLTEAGELWLEIGETLDELILGGRPSRMIHLRYREVEGMNWLTLAEDARPSKWPSERVNTAIGVPSHDLRTLAADYLRRFDPERAADLIAAHLGHASQEAGESYRALCEGDAAARTWHRDREKIAAAG